MVNLPAAATAATAQCQAPVMLSRSVRLKLNRTSIYTPVPPHPYPAAGVNQYKAAHTREYAEEIRRNSI